MAGDQLRAIGGVLSAIAILIVLWFLQDKFPPVVLTLDDPGARLAMVGQWLLLPGFALLAGIIAAGNSRFLSAAIDGRPDNVAHTLEINLRYNRNTIEQLVLSAIAWTGLALVLPAERLNLIPVLSVVFLVGRIAFWIGYLYAPWARAFGFGLTAYPTVIIFIWLAWTLAPLKSVSQQRAVTSVDAVAAEKAPAYLVALNRYVHDRAKLEQYWEAAGPTLAAFGARRVASYTPLTLLEMSGPLEGAVIVAFPDAATAKSWYESAAYQNAKTLRAGAADAEIFIIEGGAVPAAERMPNTKDRGRN